LKIFSCSFPPYLLASAIEYILELDGDPPSEKYDELGCDAYVSPNTVSPAILAAKLLSLVLLYMLLYIKECKSFLAFSYNFEARDCFV